MNPVVWVTRLFTDDGVCGVGELAATVFESAFGAARSRSNPLRVRGGLLDHFRGWITRLSHRRRRPRCRRASKTASWVSSNSDVPVAVGRVDASVLSDRCWRQR
jgi:hypothetical protein